MTKYCSQQHYLVAQLPLNMLDFLYQERLAALGLELSQTIISLNEKSRFSSVKTFVPKYVPRAKLLDGHYAIDFHIEKEIGKRMTQDRMKDGINSPTYSLWLQPTIHSYLQQNTNNVCVVECFYLKLDSPYSVPTFEKSNLSYSSYRDEMYIFLNNESSLEDISNAVGIASSLHEIYILTEHHLGSFFKKNNVVLSNEDLVELASNVQKIIVAAYDGVSFILYE